MSSSSPSSSTTYARRRHWRRNLAGAVIVLSLLAGTDALHAQTLSSQWSAPSDVTQLSGAAHGAWGLMLCDPYQNVHMLWSDMATDGAAIYYRNDSSGNWSSPVDVLSIPGHSMLRLSGAISDPTNTLHILWTDAELHGNIHYSHAPLSKASDPRAWSSPVELIPNAESASIAVDRSGGLHVIYGSYDQEGLQLEVDYLHSEDDGLTWSSPETIFSTVAPVRSGISALFTIDGAGRFHTGVTMRSLKYGVYSEVGYLRSIDGGHTWEPYRRISASKIDLLATGTIDMNLSTLAPYAFGQDEIHLTWHDPRRMHQWSSDGGVTWSAQEEIMPLAPALGGPNALAQDSAGIVHVVTAVGGAVYSAGWDGKQWSAPEQIETRPIDPHAQSLIVCQGNQLHVAYDDRNDAMKVWYSGRSVNAPHRDRQAIPTPEPSSTAKATTPVVTQLVVTPTPSIDLLDIPRDLDTRRSDPVGLLAAATVPVLILIAGVYGWRHRR